MLFNIPITCILKCQVTKIIECLCFPGILPGLHPSEIYKITVKTGRHTGNYKKLYADFSLPPTPTLTDPRLPTTAVHGDRICPS